MTIVQSNRNPTHHQRQKSKMMHVKINIEGSEMETNATADPHSFYTILTECPDGNLLGEDIEIALKGGEVKAKGRFITESIYINGRETAGQIIHVPTFPEPIIGWKQLCDLGLMPADMRKDFVIDVPPVLIEVRKDLKCNTDPAKIRQRHLKEYLLLIDAKRIIASWERKGLIERCDSVCNNPISLAIKSNGKVKIRFHFSKLNACSEKEKSTLVDREGAIEAITLGKYYSVLTLFYAEWQIPLDTYTKYKTAFTFLGKQYVWNRLPGNFQNTASRLSKALGKVLDQLPQNMRKRMTCYRDSILISAETMEKCRTFTDKLRRHLEDYSFEIRHKQCLCQPKVTYLGREIKQDGVRLGSDVINMVEKITCPTYGRHLREILNRLKDVMRYTPGFGIFSSSLSELTSQDTINWDKKSEAVLIGLKEQLLLNRPVVPGLAENEACTVQIFVKGEAWMAQILNSAEEPYRFGSGLFPPLKKEDSFAIKELKAMKKVWKTYKNVLENREVNWEVESPDIVRYKDDPNTVPQEKHFNLDVLESPGCRIKIVDPSTREPPIPWPEFLSRYLI